MTRPGQWGRSQDFYLARVVIDADEHWIWKLAVNNQGYGPHRDVYEAFVGSIPRGAQLHHKCLIKRCVNPAHLQPVSQGQNRIIDDTQRRGQMSRKQLRVARLIHKLVVK